LKGEWWFLIIFEWINDYYMSTELSRTIALHTNSHLMNCRASKAKSDRWLVFIYSLYHLKIKKRTKNVLIKYIRIDSHVSLFVIRLASMLMKCWSMKRMAFTIRGSAYDGITSELVLRKIEGFSMNYLRPEWNATDVSECLPGQRKNGYFSQQSSAD
jgi:hypothetical protein